MDITQSVAIRIETLCKQRGWTINHLAGQAAMPASTLKNILNGRSQNPGIVTIHKLCIALGVSLETFFSDLPAYE